VSGKFTAYLADPLGDLDVGRFGHQIGGCTGQQTWECLAMLGALRLWLTPWRSERVVLRVRSDSTTALQ